MTNPFASYEEWRLIALSELLGMFVYIDQEESCQGLCDRLREAADKLEGFAVSTPREDPLAEFFVENLEELKQFRAGVLPND